MNTILFLLITISFTTIIMVDFILNYNGTIVKEAEPAWEWRASFISQNQKNKFVVGNHRLDDDITTAISAVMYEKNHDDTIVNQYNLHLEFDNRMLVTSLKVDQVGVVL